MGLLIFDVLSLISLTLRIALFSLPPDNGKICFVAVDYLSAFDGYLNINVKIIHCLAYLLHTVKLEGARKPLLCRFLETLISINFNSIL
ncbi:hypothetical protein MCHI_001107 [Candidatus Magnetoovum chiemensis]|nr:hypothetical protein MCHI_001107 [Candidatus Magnetoovum chiemensis]